MFEYLKKLYRVIKRKDFLCKTSVKIPEQRLGSIYGGWWVSPQYLNKNSIVISVGLGEDISFDLAVTEAFKCTVHGFDPTPKSLTYLQNITLPKTFHLHPFAVSNTDGELTFNLPEKSEHVSGSLETINSTNKITVTCKSIPTIINELAIGTIDLLKMDIEGSEYSVIEHMIGAAIYPKQLLIEYHHFFDSIPIAETQKSIRFLLSNGYELFHIEGYNYSFIHKHLST